MPRQKNGERPYPEAPKWHFWDPCMGLFFCVSGILSSPHLRLSFSRTDTFLLFFNIIFVGFSFCLLTLL